MQIFSPESESDGLPMSNCTIAWTENDATTCKESSIPAALCRRRVFTVDWEEEIALTLPPRWGQTLDRYEEKKKSFFAAPISVGWREIESLQIEREREREREKETKVQSAMEKQKENKYRGREFGNLILHLRVARFFSLNKAQCAREERKRKREYEREKERGRKKAIRRTHLQRWKIESKRLCKIIDDSQLLRTQMISQRHKLKNCWSHLGGLERAVKNYWGAVTWISSFRNCPEKVKVATEKN